MIITVNFQFKQLEERSLKNIRASTGALFTFIYNRSTICISYIFHLYHCCTSLITVSIINRTLCILIFVELQASQARVASIYEEELELQHPLFDVHGYDEKKVSTFSKCIAQLVVYRTGIAEVTGLTPVEALIVSGLLLSNCLNWKIYCNDHSSLSHSFVVAQPIRMQH